MSPVIAARLVTPLAQEVLEDLAPLGRVAVPLVLAHVLVLRQVEAHHHRLRAPELPLRVRLDDRLLEPLLLLGAEEGAARVVGRRARLQQRVVARLRVAVLALVGEEELGQAADPHRAVDLVLRPLHLDPRHRLEEGLVAVAAAAPRTGPGAGTRCCSRSSGPSPPSRAGRRRSCPRPRGRPRRTGTRGRRASPAGPRRSGTCGTSTGTRRGSARRRRRSRPGCRGDRRVRGSSGARRCSRRGRRPGRRRPPRARPGR